ncbi:MAG: flagellar protein FlaG [Lachnospiraceae bacterium]|jgi:flagellar protein FlaG|nr:flagellar protein FlaG [Lachnospiraceae bacterium]
MAVEPLGSLMSVQAQNISVKKPSSTEVSQQTQVKEVSQDVAIVDKTTPAVEYARSKEQADNGDNSKQQPKEQTTEQMKRAVDKLNKSLPHSEAIFGFHDATNRVTIKIVDKETKEVLKELPPEKTLDMISKVWELAGMLIDEKR